MKNLSIKNRVLLKYGFIATAVYILYFLIMKVAGLAGIPELRFVNYFLYFFVTYYALYDLVKVKKVGMEYLEGMAFSFVLGAISFLTFAVFVLVYSLFSPFFLEIVGREMQSANQLGIFAPAFIVSAEGFGISAVVSLCMMQYFQAFSSRRQLFLFHGSKFFEMQERQEEAGKFATNHY
ncbi:MAG: hypothetical protein ABI763_04285 [Bacteroidota bacterium]